MKNRQTCLNCGEKDNHFANKDCKSCGAKL